MTDRKHKALAKKWGMTSEEYAALRIMARKNLEARKCK